MIRIVALFLLLMVTLPACVATTYPVATDGSFHSKASPAIDIIIDPALSYTPIELNESDITTSDQYRKVHPYLETSSDNVLKKGIIFDFVDLKPRWEATLQSPSQYYYEGISGGTSEIAQHKFTTGIKIKNFMDFKVIRHIETKGYHFRGRYICKLYVATFDEKNRVLTICYFERFNPEMYDAFVQWPSYRLRLEGGQFNELKYQDEFALYQKANEYLLAFENRADQAVQATNSRHFPHLKN